MTDPNYIAYQSSPQQTIDENHLRTLSIMHYVLGGLQLLFSCFALIYIGMGIFLMSDVVAKAQPATSQPFNTQGFHSIGLVMVIFGSVALLIGWALGILTIIAGRRLQARRSYVLCIVVAAIQCIFFPLGTALGVFTLIVLSRQSVSAIFKANSPAAAVV